MSCRHFYVPGACVFTMALWRCCVPSLQEPVTAEVLAVARSMSTVAFSCWIFWLALFREETSLWQEKAHFAGLYQLLLAYISNAEKLEATKADFWLGTCIALGRLQLRCVPSKEPRPTHCWQMFSPDDLILIPEISKSLTQSDTTAEKQTDLCRKIYVWGAYYFSLAVSLFFSPCSVLYWICLFAARLHKWRHISHDQA